MPPLPPLAPEDHRCDACGMSYPSTTVDAALDMVRDVPSRLRTAIDTIPPQHRRTRPAPDVWSITEYVCHVRDVYATSTIRLHRTRTEDAPALEPMLNDLRARRFRYNELDLAPVLVELAHNCEGLLDEAARLDEEDWARTATRLPGEARTALWLLRQAAHEGRHHVGDVVAVGRAMGTHAGRTVR